MTDLYGSLMKEQTTFVQNLPKWLPRLEQQWVWINGTEVNFYSSYEDAIESAHKKGYTKGPIFIEKIAEGYQLKLFPGTAYYAQ